MSQARFAITVELQVRPADLATFVDLVSTNAAASVRDEPGCLRFDVLLPDATYDPSLILLYEVYSDAAAFDRHLGTAHYAAFDRASKAMVLGKQVRMFRPIVNGG